MVWSRPASSSWANRRPWPSARRGYVILADRRAAIRAALAGARPGDVVVIAGKGHEDYQIIGTRKHHFDDREEVRHYFSAREVG